MSKHLSFASEVQKIKKKKKVACVDHSLKTNLKSERYDYQK
jgi:hypothetical protein